MSSFSLFLFLTINLLFVLSASEKNIHRKRQTDCNWSIGEWSNCTNNSQNRSITCLCDDGTTSNQCPFPVPQIIQSCTPPAPKIYPYPRPPVEDDDDDDEPEVQCKWRWTKWSPCTKDCGSGNTTREGRCFCDGIKTPVAVTKCATLNYRLDTLTVPCNQFSCVGGIPACNKICWMQRQDEPKYQNTTNGIFQCSQGCPQAPSSCPKGLSYSDVLFNPVPVENAEWYYLAKEWYAAILNQAAGIQFPVVALDAIKDAATLLEDCTGWGEQEVVQVYTIKEKLGRANNNIGGLDDVDAEVADMIGIPVTPPTNAAPPRYPARTLWIIAFGVPLCAVLIVSLTLGLAVYYSRRQPPFAVVEQVNFESEEEEDQDNVPLQSETGPAAAGIPLEG